MRSRSNFFRLSSFILITMLLVVAGFSSTSVQALFQATAAATMAAGASACPPSVTSYTPPPPATMAATQAAALPALMKPVLAQTAAATAVATAAAPAATMAATEAAPAGPSAALTGDGCLFAAALSGANEVPNPGAPEGSGVAIVLVNAAKSEVCYEVTVEGITLPAAAAHIHKAAAGVAGPVVVPLQVVPDAKGKAAGCTTGVAADIVQGLLTAPADYYVNVHTSDFQGGAVRGQLYGATKLTGAAEKPNPGDPDGVGAASVWIDPKAGRLCYAVQVYGISLPATAAHIHRAAPDASGPVIIPFPAAPGENGAAAACTAGANTTVVQDVLANAGNYYVNVHTADFAAGAVRGQLAAK